MNINMYIPTLNTRETALVIWAVFGLCWALTKPKIRRSTLQLFRTLVESKVLLAVFFSAALWECVAVLIVWRLGYWHANMAKLAVLWYFGTALAALGNFKGSTSNYLLSVVVKGFGLAAVIDFVGTLYTFPITAELLFVPLMFVLAGMLAVSDLSPRYAQVKSCLSFAAGLVGFSFLGYSVFMTVRHAPEILTVQTLESFFFPFALAVWFLPFFYFNRLLTVTQQNLTWVELLMQANPELLRYTKTAVFRCCGLSVARASFFGNRFTGRFWDMSTKADVDEVVHEFVREWRGRKSGLVDEGSAAT